MSPQLMQLISTIAAVIVLAYFFANVEIHVEGPNGWAAQLPTWRVEGHWLLKLCWGGRAMTGYHAWVFPFIALFFHFPLVWTWHWSWQAEAKAAASIMVFWIAEDFLWFLINPSFGWKRFHPDHATWHKHWLAGMPVEYPLFSVLAAWLYWYAL